MFYSIEVCRCGWPTGGVVIIKKVQIKDRELFTVSQLTELEDRYKNLRQEKDRITHLLKEENEDLKNQNRVLSKLKLESSNIQSKSTLYESKK